MRSWLKNKILAVKLDQGCGFSDLSLKQQLLVEGKPAAVGNCKHRSIESGCPRQGDKEKIYVVVVAKAMLENVQRTLILFEFLPFDFCFTALALVREVSDLLRPGIKLAQLLLRISLGSHDLDS